MRVPKLLQNTAIYSFISFLQKGISFFLLPLYTAYLTPADYGIMNVVTSVSSLISLFILMGLQGAGTRFYYQNKNDVHYTSRLWGTLVTFVLFSSIVIFGITVLCHKFLIDPIIGDVKFFPYIFLGLANVLVTPLYLFFQSYLQSKQEGLHYGLNTFTNFLINVGLIIFFVVGLKLSVLGVLLAHVITSVIFFIYVAITFIPKIKLGIDKEILSPALKYSLPLVPHLLAGWSTGMIDRLFINGMRDEKETGLYSVASQFGSIINSVSNAVNMAYLPWFYDAFEKKDFQGIKKVGSLIVFGYCFLALGISLFSPEMLKLMVSEEFRGVWNIIPFLSFAYVFQGMYYLYINVLFLKKTKLVFVVSVSALIVNIILNILLVPVLGYIGSAVACILAFCAKSVVAMFISMFAEKQIRFSSIKSYLLVLSCFALTFLNYALQNVSVIYSLSIKLSICGCLGLIIFLRYRATIYTIIKKIRQK